LIRQTPCRVKGEAVAEDGQVFRLGIGTLGAFRYTVLDPKVCSGRRQVFRLRDRNAWRVPLRAVP